MFVQVTVLEVVLLGTWWSLLEEGVCSLALNWR